MNTTTLTLIVPSPSTAAFTTVTIAPSGYPTQSATSSSSLSSDSIVGIAFGIFTAILAAVSIWQAARRVRIAYYDRDVDVERLEIELRDRPQPSHDSPGPALAPVTEPGPSANALPDRSPVPASTTSENPPSRPSESEL